ncbi:uncharacterized protein [Nicotiana sylvestris]|uniref:J domain-containing protein n=2 Tax=Nicotiana TaxID=4085 RepID=A0A1S4A5B1_TOBAC|nr:PREDICTED: uncharacterized protein LOC104240386 [Nicotiana sylvestris]XP_016471761.1 PREDICTED: uncharacterized protein LOC107793832 [Nicotiana tabacum]
MELTMEEALKAKANAERRFVEKDFVGAKHYALKAQVMYPHLEGISQMVATFGVHSAAETKVNGEFDFYAILGLDPSADKSKLKKQYKKMAVLLHPDKNKSVGADVAFRLVSEAWTVLSDGAKRSSYDHRRSLFTLHASGVGSYDSYSNSSVSHNRLDTFWTVCTSCHVQYEYLRKYLNKRLSCKNCRGVFIAVETGLAPVNGSYPYSSWSNEYGSHGCGVTYVPTTSVYPANTGVSGHHSGHGSEHVSNLSFQWSSSPGNSAAVLDPNRSTTVSFSNQAGRKITRRRGRGKQDMKKVVSNVVLNGYSVCNEQIPRRPGRPAKKIKIDLEGTCGYSNGEVALKTAGEVKMADGNGCGNLKQNAKLPTPTEASIRRFSAAPAFDARRLLIDKARAEIRKKLEEIKLASEVAVAESQKKRKADAEFGESSERPKMVAQENAVHQSELRKTGSMTIIVPDSDFHDFDKDRSEDCFKPKQIWALYDEEDGMPRLYCLIREIISVKPFKVHISYLSSKSDSEFGLVNWLDSGFTKSCGNFRAFNSEIVEHVNIFSHLLSREKAGRGGCVRIYPKSGDVWAVYRNWSPDWDRTTPAEVRHQYEMVEVLDDYSEELGVCVTPLIKLDGFKTVYRRNTNKDAIRLIRRREMLRFSHQVPSCLLKGEGMNLPEGCWDLDPAATPDDLLQRVNDVEEEIPREVESSVRFDLNETSQAETKMLIEEKLRQPEYAGVSDELHSTRCGLQIQDISHEPENLFRLSTELPQSVKEVHTCEEPTIMENFSDQVSIFGL